MVARTQWRIPTPHVPLGQVLCLAAIIVGDQTWPPSYHGHDVNPRTGRIAYSDRVPPLVAGAQRWCCDSIQNRLLALSPWQDEYRDV